MTVAYLVRMIISRGCRKRNVSYHLVHSNDKQPKEIRMLCATTMREKLGSHVVLRIEVVNNK